MGQWVVNMKFSAREPEGDWELGHHIGNPASGQTGQASHVLTATQESDLRTAAQTSKSEVADWIDDHVPSAWQWGTAEDDKLWNILDRVGWR